MSGLIIETSSEKGLIALAHEGALAAAQPLGGGPGLSKTLAAEIHRLVRDKPDYLFVGTGPGSYTGIRVGVALAKALAFGWDVPLFGFCSLRAFFPLEASLSPVLVDARMGGFYFLETTQAAATLLAPVQAAERLRDFPSIASPHPDQIRKRLDFPGRWIETSPDPQTLAFLSYERFLEGEPQPIALSYLTSP